MTFLLKQKKKLYTLSVNKNLAIELKLFGVQEFNNRDFYLFVR